MHPDRLFRKLALLGMLTLPVALPPLYRKLVAPPPIIWSGLSQPDSHSPGKSPPRRLPASPLKLCSPCKILFWNVKNYRAESPSRIRLKSFQPFPPKPEDLRQLVASIIASENPNIIVLAEMGSEKDCAELQSRLAKLGSAYPHSASVRAPGSNQLLAILSQFPLSHNYSLPIVPLPYPHPECMKRGILDCEFLADSLPLRVVAFHLKSQLPSDSLDQAKTRALEARQLRTRIDSILASSPSTPLIVVGDMNDLPNSRAFSIIKGQSSSQSAPQTQLRQLRPTDAQGMAWTHYHATSDTYQRLDYVFTSQSTPKSRACRICSHPRQLDASDHRAIILEL